MRITCIQCPNHALQTILIANFCARRFCRKAKNIASVSTVNAPISQSESNGRKPNSHNEPQYCSAVTVLPYRIPTSFHIARFVHKTKLGSACGGPDSALTISFNQNPFTIYEHIFSFSSSSWCPSVWHCLLFIKCGAIRASNFRHVVNGIGTHKQKADNKM